MKKNLKSIEKIYGFFLLHNLTAKLSKETNKLISIKKKRIYNICVFVISRDILNKCIYKYFVKF